MPENPTNSPAIRIPLVSRAQRFLDQKNNEIDQILFSLPKASPITDPSSDILTTDYVDNVVSQLSKICEQYRVVFSLPKEGDTSDSPGWNYFLGLMRKKYPNGYIGDHTRLGNSPQSAQVGSFGELWVPGNSRIIHYKSFSKSLQASLEKLSTDLEYRLEKEKQIEDLKSAFEKELGEYFREARTDQLTQLSNRRAMVEYMYRESQAINNQNQPKKYHIATIDLDFFKRVNDTGGHALGDSVLKRFTKVLTDILEKKGIKAYRTGGEEFTIIWNSDTAGSEILDAIQAAIANDQVDLGDTTEEIQKTKEEIKSNIIKYATLSVTRKKARMEIMNGALNSDQKDQACERYDTENPLPTPPMKCTEGFNSIKYTASIGFAEIEISPKENIADVLTQFNAGWKLSDGASYDAKRAGRNNIQQRKNLEGLPDDGGRLRDLPIPEKIPTSNEIENQLRILGFTDNQINEILEGER